MSQSSRKFFSAAYFNQQMSTSNKMASNLLLTRLQELLSFCHNQTPHIAAASFCLEDADWFGHFLTGWDFCF